MAIFPHAPESDELAYRSMALNLVHGNGIIDLFGNRAMYNVGYPLFILAPIYALFGENLLIIRLLHILLGASSILLAYAIAREAGLGRFGRHLTAALWAVYLPATLYAVYLGKENLVVPLMIGVIWCALRLAKEPARPVALLCGILLGLVALSGSAGLALVGAVATGLAFTPANPVRRAGLSVLVLGAGILVALPWVIRNDRVLGSPVLNTNGPFNFYLGNNPAATGSFLSISDTPRGPSWEQLRRAGEVEASRALALDAVNWIRENPTAFASLAVKKALYFWAPPIYPDTGTPSRMETAARFVWSVQFIAIVAAALGSLVGFGVRNRHVVIVWIGIAAYTSVYMLCYASVRYQLVIMPLMCLLAGSTSEHLLEIWRTASRPTESSVAPGASHKGRNRHPRRLVLPDAGAVARKDAGKRALRSRLPGPPGPASKGTGTQG